MLYITTLTILYITINCELCDIKDGRHIACDIISKAEVCKLLDIICTE